MRSSKGRARRGHEDLFVGAVPRAAGPVIALVFATASFAVLPARLVHAGNRAAAFLVPPAVSPDRIDDVPPIQIDVSPFHEKDDPALVANARDPSPNFENFAWRAFVALNWPALTDPAHRGQPDRAKTLDAPGPRVWETMKSRYELFQVDAGGKRVAPQRWATYEAANPCGASADGAAKTLASFDPFMDFNEAGADPGVAFNPLVAQNHTYTRYETRVNEAEYVTLASGGWGEGRNLPDTDHPARLPIGSIAVKAAWRPLTAADTPAIRARYYVVENANIVDIAKTRAAGKVVCSKGDVALVGLHIVVRTPDRPQGLWSSFEHVDNVPPAGTGEDREPDARDAGAPYSYFDASKPKLGLWPMPDSPALRPVSLSNPPALDPTPMQVVRQHPIHSTAMSTNRTFWALPGIKGTVWEHYMLVAAQWPTVPQPVAPYNDGVFFPETRPENYVNTTLDTFTQNQSSSCMSCHQVFNSLGHDFVGMLGSFR